MHTIYDCTEHVPSRSQCNLHVLTMHVTLQLAIPVRNDGILWHLTHIHAEAVFKGVRQRGVEALDKWHAVPWLHKPP